MRSEHPLLFSNIKLRTSRANARIEAEDAHMEISIMFWHKLIMAYACLVEENLLLPEILVNGGQIRFFTALVILAIEQHESK